MCVFIIMKILGISLSEFHDKAGFQLVESVPQVTVLTKQQFNLCSDLILPRAELCGRLLGLQFKEDYFLVVKPLLSINQDKDKTYKRQKYIYSISMLVWKKDYLDKVKQPLYKQMVSKIAKFFKIMQQTNHIIYHHQQHTQYIVNILTNLYEEINSKGFCHLTYQCHYFTFINVNRPPHLQQKFKIHQSSVPTTLLSQQQIQEVESPLGRQLLRYAYKGTFTFKKICKIHSDKKEAQIKAFYQIAVNKGLVFILDMINLHNIYVLTQKITDYVPENAPGRDQLKNIAKMVNITKDELDVDELLSFYLQFNRVATLGKLIQSNRRLMARVDIVKLIRLAQINGFLVRNHHKLAYSQLPSPLILSDPLKKWLAQRESRLNIAQKFQQEMQNMTQIIKKYLGANLTVDQMMVNLDIDYERLLSLLNQQNRFVLQINDD